MTTIPSPPPRRPRRLPVAPAVASAAAWGGGAVMHAALPQPAAALVTAAAAGVTGGAALLASWHGYDPGRRLWASTAAGWWGTWATMAACGVTHGPTVAGAIAGAGLLSLGFRGREARPEASEQEAPAPDRATLLEAEWHAYVACDDGPLPGAQLRDITPVASGLAAEVWLRRGKQEASWAIRQASRVASGLDLPPTQVVLEHAPDGRSSRARLTVLDRDVLAGSVPWAGSELDPATGIAACGRYFDGLPAHVRFWLPGNGSVHWLLAGTTGSGKTSFLHWLLATVTDPAHPVPVSPLIIDPQDAGQSLIAWQHQLTRAYRGEDEAIAALRGLDAMMTARGHALAAKCMDYFEPTAAMPLLLAIIEEAPALLKGRHKDEALRLLIRLGTMARKVGISIVLVTQFPGLEQLGSQVLRSMMRSGNVVCGRTADPESKGMLGLERDPSTLPRYFANGSPAYGVFLIDGPDGRQAAPLRSREMPRDVKERIIPAAAEHPLDYLSAQAFSTAFEGSFAPADTAREPAARAVVPLHGPVPAGSAEAILRVLADGQPRMRGAIIDALADQGVTASASTVTAALAALRAQDLVQSAGDKQPWQITPAGRAAAERAQAA